MAFREAALLSPIYWRFAADTYSIAEQGTAFPLTAPQTSGSLCLFIPRFHSTTPEHETIAWSGIPPVEFASNVHLYWTLFSWPQHSEATEARRDTNREPAPRRQAPSAAPRRPWLVGEDIGEQGQLFPKFHLTGVARSGVPLDRLVGTHCRGLGRHLRGIFHGAQP